MNEKEISKLIDKFDHSNLNELRIDNGGSTIYFNKNGQKPSSNDNEEILDDDNDKSEDTDKSSKGKSNKKPANGKSIKAPLVGIVYFAPSPKKPNFKEVGDHVKKGEVVCEIEAMKVLNDVKSPVDGTIKKRLVKNSSMVEYHQAIFEIEAD